MTLNDLQAIAVIVSSVVVAVTIVLTYRQVKIAAKSYEFQTLTSLQSLIDSFERERVDLYKSLPSAIIATSQQFSDSPPRHDHPPKALVPPSDTQIAALNSLDDEQIRAARTIINRLNDIAQLVEHRHVRESIFLSKYHTMVIRLTHLVEVIRVHIENESGAYYGHRVLRLRSKCIRYHYRNPKHRPTGIYIKMEGVSRRLIHPARCTFWTKVYWIFYKFFQ